MRKNVPGHNLCLFRKEKDYKMKQITKTVMLISVLMILGNISAINTTAEEVIIESVTKKIVNPWDNRPLIQTTSFTEEYIDAVKLGAFMMPECQSKDSEILYEEASKCVVRIEMGQYAGSGLIWRMEEKGMVIAANKHLLCEAAYGTVTFVNGVALRAEILGYSQEYDLGFLWIERGELTWEMLRDYYEVRLIEEVTEEIEKQNIIQIASSQQAAADCYEGVINGKIFVPEFQTFMLETACFSKAGMSGGGVFDEHGYLLGMIAGGEAAENDSQRVAEITYSIPAEQIEFEYQRIRESLQE